jgi:hypothetical protein
VYDLASGYDHVLARVVLCPPSQRIFPDPQRKEAPRLALQGPEDEAIQWLKHLGRHNGNVVDVEVQCCYQL